jgi:hypothetical protein
VRSFDASEAGESIGWLVSAPPDVLKRLTDGVTVSDIAAPGFSRAQCWPYLELVTVLADKVDPKNRDASIQSIHEGPRRVTPQTLSGEVVKQTIHGFPAAIFAKERRPGDRYKVATRSMYVVVEAGKHLIYLVYSVNYDKKENREACMNSHMALFQEIGESLRPAPPPAPAASTAPVVAAAPVSPALVVSTGAVAVSSSTSSR